MRSRNLILNQGDTNIRFPDTVNVHEHKAPTDESIRLMEEMHKKALDNIIAKVKVEDNLVNGECYCIDQPWNMNEIKLVFKFKINGQEFVVEKEINRFDILREAKDLAHIQLQLGSYLKAVMLWYALKKFTQVAYEQITGAPFSNELFSEIISK